jgi:hypothetical protein
MTDQPSGAGLDNPVGTLQPLGFKLISDDGRAARYEALVGDQTAPGSPVFAVTVTIASSIQLQAPTKLQELLSQMEASVVLLPEPPPDNGGPSDDEPFDLKTQLLIEVSLASSGGTRPVGVAVTMKTTTGIVPAPTGSKPGSGVAIRTVPAGLDDYWQVRPKNSFTARVTPSIGEGTIRNPVTPVVQGRTSSLTARQVIVHADRQAMTYFMSSSFRLVRHGVGP